MKLTEEELKKELIIGEKSGFLQNFNRVDFLKKLKEKYLSNTNSKKS